MWCVCLCLNEWTMLFQRQGKANNNNNNCIQRHNSRFFTISSLRRELSPTRTLKCPGRNHVQITCSTSSAYHVPHVVLRAMWYEGTAQLLSLTELKLHLFELYFIGWTINCWSRGGNRSTWRKPLAMSFRKSNRLQIIFFSFFFLTSVIHCIRYSCYSLFILFLFLNILKKNCLPVVHCIWSGLTQFGK